MLMTRVANKAVEQSSGTGLEQRLWAAIVDATMAEVYGNASADQARGFFAALGRRIAATMPLDDVENLETLAERINLLWASLGWGSVTLSLDDEGIDLHHCGIPHLVSGDDGRWMATVGSLLEGAYDAWFRNLGSSDKLRTRIISQSEDKLDLRHAL